MIDEILAQIPSEELAAQLGTDPDTAMDAARKALPALLGGLSSNVSLGGGDALGAALQRDHDGSLLDSPNPLAAVDATDGGKIIGHIFGDKQDAVVERLGATSRAGSSVFTKLLPLLAPLVMAWLAKKVGGALSGGTQQAATGAVASSQPAGILGGTPAAQPSAQSGGGLGGLLGGLFGGGSQPTQSAPAQAPAAPSSGGGLGGLLGGLFGGGSQPAQSAPAQPTAAAGVPTPDPAGGLGGLLGGEGAGGSLGSLLGGGGGGGGIGSLLGGLLGREVEQEREAMPDLGGLFDLFGGQTHDAESESGRGE